MKISNLQAQSIYWCAKDEQFNCKEGSPVYNELGKVIEQDPFTNNEFEPEIDSQILGYWLHNEIIGLIDFHESEEEQPEVESMMAMIDLEAATETYYDSTRKRFKILSLLCLEMGVLDTKMDELAKMMDENHIEAVEALGYYEDKIIEIFETQEA